MVEDGNQKLKKLLAEAMPDVPALKSVGEKCHRSSNPHVAVEKPMVGQGFSAIAAAGSTGSTCRYSRQEPL